jgi:DNA-directed RNA polymerase beta subunit
MFPITGKKNILEIGEVTYDESKTNLGDLRSQEQAKHSEKTWGVPVYAEFVLKDKLTGQVINKTKQKIADMPKLTQRETYIVGGGEYNSAYQWRLKSGIYSKIKENGQYETEFNLNGAGKDFAREQRLKIPFDPETKQFKLKYATVAIPLYSMLKADDVPDEKIKEVLGEDIYKANFRKNWQADIVKLYNAKLKKRGVTAATDSFDDIKKAIQKELHKAEVLPETTKLTLGKEYKELSGDVLLHGADHIRQVTRGKKPDDVYSLYFKHLLGLDDFIAEKFGESKTALKIKSKIRNNLDRKDSVSQIVGKDLFTKPLGQVFYGNALSQRPDQTNPLDMMSAANLTTIKGPGGISSEHAIRNSMKIVNQSHLGYLDSLLTPESTETGISLHLPLGVKKVGREARALVFNIQDQKYEYVNPAQLHGELTVLPDQIKIKDGKPVPRKEVVTVIDPKTHEFIDKPYKEAKYVLPSPRNLFSEATNLIPFLQCNQGNRTMTGSRQPSQGVPLANKEQPLVQVQSNGSSSYETLYGKKFSHQSPVDGKVVDISKDELGHANAIHIKGNDNKNYQIQVYNHFPLNDKKSFLHAEPVIKIGDEVKKGQTLADSNFTSKGTLAIGTNLRTAYFPYGSFTYEDSVIISEAASKKLASEHLHKISIDIDPTSDKVSLNKFLTHISSIGKKIKKDKLESLGEEGVIKPGTKVKPGDILVAAVTKNELDESVSMMSSRLKGAIAERKDKSLVWEHDYEGEVKKVIPKSGGKGYTVYVKTVEPAQVGDKVCYDEETEILTKTGWKFVKDLELDDYVATLNPTNDELEYHQPNQLHKYVTGGNMYKIKSQQVDLLVTQDHNMYVKKRGRKNYELVSAKSIYGKRVQYKKNAVWKGSSPKEIIFNALEIKAGQSGRGTRMLPEIKMSVEAYMTLLGAFLSEGNILNQPNKGNFGIEITQIKQPNRSLFIEELKRLRIKHLDSGDKIRIISKQLMEHFIQFGKSYQKYIPEFVFDFAKEDLEILFKWLMWGDGTSKNGMPIAYTTTSKKLADDVQRLCLHIGKAGNVILSKLAEEQTIKGKIYWCRDRYDVRIVNTKLSPEVNHGHIKSQLIQEEKLLTNYVKPVYCLTVKNHIVYVRRNGKSVFSGNCGRSGDKNIIGAILPNHEMPYVKNADGTKSPWAPYHSSE